MPTILERKDVLEQIGRIKTADIVVGIPSFNNARTIGHVVRAVQAGLAKYFPGKKSVLVGSDGGSTDDTLAVVRNTSIEDYASILLHHRVEPVFKIATPYSGIPARERFRTILRSPRRWTPRRASSSIRTSGASRPNGSNSREARDGGRSD
jgi:glycosyltransferase involved in cell wall biosynthesis